MNGRKNPAGKNGAIRSQDLPQSINLEPFKHAKESSDGAAEHQINLESRRIAQERTFFPPPPPYPTPPLLLHPNVAHSQLEWTGNDTIIERPFLQKSRVTITSHFDLAQISIWFVKKEETKHETKQQQKGGKNDNNNKRGKGMGRRRNDNKWRLRRREIRKKKGLQDIFLQKKNERK